MPVTVFSFDQDGATCWGVTTDIEAAQAMLGGDTQLVLAEADVADVLEDQYEGVALLSTFSPL